jgi:hypothetical protein
MIDVWFYRGADCDTDNYLVIAEVREKLWAKSSQSRKIGRWKLTARK